MDNGATSSIPNNLFKTAYFKERGNPTWVTVKGPTIPYWGISRVCLNCKHYHLTHLPSGLLAIHSPNLHALKTAALIALDTFGDALDLNENKPGSAELRKALWDVLSKYGSNKPSHGQGVKGIWKT